MLFIQQINQTLSTRKSLELQSPYHFYFLVPTAMIMSKSVLIKHQSIVSKLLDLLVIMPISPAITSVL